MEGISRAIRNYSTGGAWACNKDITDLEGISREMRVIQSLQVEEFS
jgi:hypothetical protein